MVVYNVTIKINPQIEQDWVQWLKQEHIPEVMATGLFTSHQVYRLLLQDESDGITYVVQYAAASPDDYNQYVHQHATGLRKKADEKWGGQYVAFRTLMQVVP